MFFPSEAALHTARVHSAYETLRQQFVAFGRVPPSLEQVIEVYRRHPSWDVFRTIFEIRARMTLDL